MPLFVTIRQNFPWAKSPALVHALEHGEMLILSILTRLPGRVYLPAAASPGARPPDTGTSPGRCRAGRGRGGKVHLKQLFSRDELGRETEFLEAEEKRNPASTRLGRGIRAVQPSSSETCKRNSDYSRQAVLIRGTWRGHLPPLPLDTQRSFFQTSLCKCQVFTAHFKHEGRSRHKSLDSRSYNFSGSRRARQGKSSPSQGGRAADSRPSGAKAELCASEIRC